MWIRSRRNRYKPLATMIAAPSQVTASGSTPHRVTSISTPHTSAVYSRGALCDASPIRKASVMNYWPSAPAKPTTPITQRSAARIGTHCGHASAPAPKARITSSHTIIDAVESVRPSTRTVIALTA